MNKIDEMHRLFGTDYAHTCGECKHFFSYTESRKWFKCRLYGDSRSESTDWRKSYVACGNYNKQLDKDFIPVVQRVIHAPKLHEDEQIPGQMDMWGN